MQQRQKIGQELREKLFEVYSYENFRNNQEEILISILEGNDMLVLMPSGGGKSLLFQMPCIIDKKITLVVMPLISLIQDQIYQLQNIGIKATDYSNNESLEEILNEEIQIIFVTPEKLFSNLKLMQVLEDLFKMQHMKRVFIDEAHCISQWGSDFRMDFKKLKQLKQIFQGIQMVGLTATAPPKVKQEIIQELKFDFSKFKEYISSFNRPNLFYSVEEYKEEKDYLDQIVWLAKQKTKTKCEEISKALNSKGVSCNYYHAGRSPLQRQQIQLDWMVDRVQIVVATIALGMGINKPDTRFVIHVGLSKSIEAYYQESGRAGRDGNFAECKLFYNSKDKQTMKFIISNASNNINPQWTGNNQPEQVQMDSLNQMDNYCLEKKKCRRQIQLNYLGEAATAELCKKMCDNCSQKEELLESEKSYDLTEQIGVIIREFKSIKYDFHLTEKQLQSTLIGASIKVKSQYAQDILGRSKMFGLLKFKPAEFVSEFVRQLVSENYFYTKSIKMGLFMNTYIFLNHQKCDNFINNSQKFIFKSSSVKGLSQRLQENQKKAEIAIAAKSLQPANKWNFARKNTSQNKESSGKGLSQSIVGFGFKKKVDINSNSSSNLNSNSNSTQNSAEKLKNENQRENQNQGEEDVKSGKRLLQEKEIKISKEPLFQDNNNIVNSLNQKEIQTIQKQQAYLQEQEKINEEIYRQKLKEGEDLRRRAKEENKFIFHSYFGFSTMHQFESQIFQKLKNLRNTEFLKFQEQKNQQQQQQQQQQKNQQQLQKKQFQQQNNQYQQQFQGERVFCLENFISLQNLKRISKYLPESVEYLEFLCKNQRNLSAEIKEKIVEMVRLYVQGNGIDKEKFLFSESEKKFLWGK